MTESSSIFKIRESLTPKSIAEERSFEGNVFPLTLSPSESCSIEKLESCLKENKSHIDDLLRLHKGILFRGFTLSDHNDFDRIIQAIDYKTMSYLGGAAVRTQLTDRVFTANESPSTEKIPFHHEMAQTPKPPTHLFFFCETAPTVGGQTPILVSTEICDECAKTMRGNLDKLEELGVKYVRNMPEDDDPSSAIGRGWKSTFLCTDKEGAEKGLSELGSSFEWLDDGCLRTVTKVVPAIKHDSGDNRSNRKTFFNSLVAAYTGWNDSRNDGKNAVVFGDDSTIDPAFIETAAKVMDEIKVSFTWEKGDLLLLDNRTTMHSRHTYEGPRRILASLAYDPDR